VRDREDVLMAAEGGMPQNSIEVILARKGIRGLVEALDLSTRKHLSGNPRRITKEDVLSVILLN